MKPLLNWEQLGCYHSQLLDVALVHYSLNLPIDRRPVAFESSVNIKQYKYF